MKNWSGFLSFLSRFHKLLCLCLLLPFGVCEAQVSNVASRVIIPSSPPISLSQFGTGTVALDTTYAFQKYPDPHKVLFRSMIIPGWGQIINKQIYKVPIIYALLGGLTWYSIHLTKQYHGYRAAYYNQNSQTPNDFRFGPTPINLQNVDLSFLKRQRDVLHNRRDFIYLTIVLAYGLNILDAYIFAHLRSFNVSKDLSVRTSIHPGMIAQALPGVTISFSLFSSSK